ncbi:hypothetical protein PHYC_01558 [Phycisphaerales bacterium]|nr:hypothetical protein PHYC_01558 [Phycisphaerales bacterium]
MWQGKAAAAAALLLCAHASMADGIRVHIGGTWGSGRGGGWVERHRARHEPPRRERPRFERPRVEPARHAPSIEEQRADLCIDGRAVRALVSVWVDECGRVRTRVRLESRDGLPRLEEVRLELDQDCLDYCEPLGRVDRACTERTAVYEGAGGMWYEGCARVELRIKGGRESARATWKRFRIEQM